MVVDERSGHPVDTEVAKDHFWFADCYLHVSLILESGSWIDLASFFEDAIDGVVRRFFLISS